MMKDDEREEQRSSDPAIWETGMMLSSEETASTKVDVMLRLDSELYRALLRQKKRTNERTMMASVETVLRKGLRETNDSE